MEILPKFGARVLSQDDPNSLWWIDYVMALNHANWRMEEFWLTVQFCLFD